MCLILSDSSTIAYFEDRLRLCASVFCFLFCVSVSRCGANGAIPSFGSRQATRLSIKPTLSMFRCVFLAICALFPSCPTTPFDLSLSPASFVLIEIVLPSPPTHLLRSLPAFSMKNTRLSFVVSVGGRTWWPISTLCCLRAPKRCICSRCKCHCLCPRRLHTRHVYNADVISDTGSKIHANTWGNGRN